MKQKSIKNSLILFMIVNTSIVGMEKEPAGSLPESFYSVRVAEFFERVNRVNNTECKLETDQLKEYLEDRIKGAGNKELNKVLDSQFIFLFVMNYLDTDPNARVRYVYPHMVEENQAYALRRKFGMRCGNINPAEKEYEDELRLVSDEEFGKQIEEISSDDLSEMKLALSKIFAQRILNRLENEETE